MARCSRSSPTPVTLNANSSCGPPDGFSLRAEVDVLGTGRMADLPPSLDAGLRTIPL